MIPTWPRFHLTLRFTLDSPELKYYWTWHTEPFFWIRFSAELPPDLPSTSYFCVNFLIIKTYICSYLQIGLSIGDIAAIQRTAQLKLLTMQVDYHTDVEKRLPKKYLANVNRKLEDLVVYPNKLSDHVFNSVSRRMKYTLSIQASCPALRIFDNVHFWPDSILSINWSKTLKTIRSAITKIIFEVSNFILLRTYKKGKNNLRFSKKLTFSRII